MTMSKIKAGALFSSLSLLVYAAYTTFSSNSSYNSSYNNHSSSNQNALRQLQMEDEDIMVEVLRDRLKPFEFQADEAGVYGPHQFLHLRHMKSGSTSVDDLLQCSLKRMLQIQGLNVSRYSLHEDAGAPFKKCVAGNDACNNRMDQSSVLSFCAPFRYLKNFRWIEADDDHLPEPTYASITELRHPVERVWSNYRFATFGCYHCWDLKDVYKALDNGTYVDQGFRMDSLCTRNMMNHETFNLLTSEKYEADEGLLDIPQDLQDEMSREAIANMKNFFTLIGVTEEFSTFAKMIPKVFPFMSPMIEGTHRACHLPHSNKTPKNNHCGPERSHKELPEHPDEETRKIIEEHNAMDMKLYEAAVKHYQLQKKALDME